jgi:methionyl-tRNA synthetase
LAPFVPDKAQLVWEAVGERGHVAKARWSDALGVPAVGQAIPEPKPLITPIDPASFVPAAKATGGSPSHPLAPLDLRAALIETVTPHPKADKLYLLQLDLGDHKRQVVAGLRLGYKPEELAGKTCIVVANLEPAKIRGEVSQGMVLAAEAGPVLSVLSAGGAAPGANVHGTTRGAKAITILQFQQFPLVAAPDDGGRVAPALGHPGGPMFFEIAGHRVRFDRDVPPGSKIR